jgi:hypothetical protein
MSRITVITPFTAASMHQGNVCFVHTIDEGEKEQAIHHVTDHR